MTLVPVSPTWVLEQHKPKRDQWRVGRRDPVKPVIVVHTAESGTTKSGKDPRAENVASFIGNRTDAGSYHLIGDADSIVRLIRFENEAYGDATGSNRWACHISLAMNAGDWASISEWRYHQLHAVAAQMAVMVAMWHATHGREIPEAVLLTKAESDMAGASGFISHERRDPGRRTDPGSGFNWHLFFEIYKSYLVADGLVSGPPAVPPSILLPPPPILPPIVQPMPTPTPPPSVPFDPTMAELQARLVAMDDRLVVAEANVSNLRARMAAMERAEYFRIAGEEGARKAFELGASHRPAQAPAEG